MMMPLVWMDAAWMLPLDSEASSLLFSSRKHLFYFCCAVICYLLKKNEKACVSGAQTVDVQLKRKMHLFNK